MRGQPVPKVWVRATLSNTRFIDGVPFVLATNLSIIDEQTGGMSFVDHMHLRLTKSLCQAYAPAANIVFRAHLSTYTRADGSSSWTLRGVSRVRHIVDDTRTGPIA
jgi:hypothetical protein